MNHLLTRQVRKSIAHSVRTFGPALLCVSLLLGLSPPLVTSVAPAPLAPLAEAAAEFLPEPIVASAAPISVPLAQTTTLFSADFENTSGDNAWTLGTGATDGDWEIGVPNPYTSSGTQVEIAAHGGTQDLLTGNGASQDLDGGPAIAQSPNIVLPASASTISLSLHAYFAHASNGDTSDYLTIEVRDASDSSTLITVVNEIGAATGWDAVWTQATADLTAHNGKTIYLYADAADLGSASKTEAAIDDVLITYESVVPGQINGTVFRDIDADAVNESSEPGIGTIVVTAYDASGNSASTTTDTSGAYTITAVSGGLSGQVRIEFTLPIDGSLNFLAPGAAGTDSSTAVQFADIDAGALVNASFHNPAQHCQTNPDLVTTCFLQGEQTGQTDDVLISFDYDAGCVDENLDGTCDLGGESFDEPAPGHLASGQEIGSTWGLAYDRSTDTLYAGSFMKRHSGFRQYGETGIIYQIPNASTGGSSPVPYVDLDALGFATGTDPHPQTTDNCTSVHNSNNNNANCWFHDSNSWDWVGKMSLGDLDISDDGRTLWTINLFRRELYAIPITTSSLTAIDITTVVLPDPGTGVTGCPIHPSTPTGELNYNVRPFATAFHDGQLYVGMVCTAESTGQANDLRAFVYAYDGANFTQVLNEGLNYPRGYVRRTAIPADWNPWVTTFTVLRDDFPSFNYSEVGYPQPWLTDIEFDNGDMILGLRDRFSDQSGFLQGSTNTSDSWQYGGDAGGDLLRACSNGTGWSLENNATCNGTSTAGAGNGQGPGGGEYYFEEQFLTRHDEISLGGLIQVAGHDTIVVPAFDVINQTSGNFDGGIIWLNNQTGERSNTFRVFDTGDGLTPVQGNTFGKAGGLGDLEALCRPAPIEIGNRVWWDDNLNGIQDPGTNEGPIAGITLELYLIDASDTLTNGQDLASVTSTLVATTQTDAEGRYFFSSVTDSANVKVLAGYNAQTWVSGIEVLPNRTYQVRIPDWDGSTGTNVANAAAIAANVPAGGTLFLAPGPNTGAGSSNVKPASDSVATNTIHDTDAYDNPGNAAIVVDTGGAGENNHALDFAFGAETPEGTITIVKQTDGNDATFTFSSADGDLNGLSIPTTGGAGSSATITKTVGTYVITEDTLAGWGVTSITFSGDTDGGSSSSGNAATIDLDEGENIVVTFNNGEIIACDAGTNDLGGTIWRDYDSDGALDAGESGFMSVTITAYDNNGLVTTAPVNSDGTYNFDNIFDGRTGNDAHIRLEFSGLPNWAQSGVQGINSGTTVQHHSAASCAADLAVQNPAQYCTNQADLVTSCYVPENQVTGPNRDLPTIVSLPETVGSNSSTASDYDTPAYTPVADAKDVGSVWGLAYRKMTGSLYLGAFIKQRAGLGPTGNPTTIYEIDDTGAISTWITLDATRADPHSGDTDGWIRDFGAFDDVFKEGIGDVDISEDDNTVYAIDLGTRELVSIAINSDGSAGTVTRVAVPTNMTDCPATDDVRPFGLGVNDGTVYLGLVCTAQSTVDENTELPIQGGNAPNDPVTPPGDTTKLRGYVYAWDGGTGFSEVLNFPLNYARGCSIANQLTNCQGRSDGLWQAWVDKYPFYDEIGTNNHRPTYAQPLITDIEFDNGDMILGLADRFGHQQGPQIFTPAYPQNEPANTEGFANETDTAGDILRACQTGPSSWIIEELVDPANSSCGTTGTSSNVGGNLILDEYYYQDDYLHDQTVTPLHSEIAVGGLLQIPGRTDVIASTYDLVRPVANQFNDGGLSWFDNQSGSWTKAYRLFDGVSGVTPDFGKAAGVGDIVAICDPAPLEIGNYVWLDDDGDGIQDPCESPIPGVTVTLHDITGTQIATATTDANGEYYFISGDDPRLEAGGVYATVPISVGVVPTTTTVGGLLPNTQYEIRIDITQAAVSTYVPTTANVDSGTTITDGVDSDGILSGINAVISLATGDAGENDHTFDFGFVPIRSLTVEKTLTSPANGVVKVGDTITFTLQITNTGSVTMTQLTLADTYDATILDYRTASTLPDVQTTGILTWTGDSGTGTGNLAGNLPLAPGGTFTIAVEFGAIAPTRP
ncbi:hypothetical protein KFU94_59825 [Chloroflexi bacterium TSY]|nr:hypothetical protein [Chloroflexi bacterium TSY]